MWVRIPDFSSPRFFFLTFLGGLRLCSQVTGNLLCFCLCGCGFESHILLLCSMCSCAFCFKFKLHSAGAGVDSTNIRLTFCLHSTYIRLTFDFTLHIRLTLDLHSTYIRLTFDLHSTYIRGVYSTHIRLTFDLQSTHIRLTSDSCWVWCLYTADVPLSANQQRSQWATLDDGQHLTTGST